MLRVVIYRHHLISVSRCDFFFCCHIEWIGLKGKAIIIMVHARQYLRFLGAALLSLGLFFAIVSPLFAQPNHAKVISSDPAINSVIKQAPTKITVTTAENMKPGATNSNLQVYGPDYALISQGNAVVGLNDPTKMSVNVKPEKNGVYIVRWYTVSADDGDAAQGAFSFTVGTAASTIVTAQPTTAAQAPSSASTSSSSGTPLWVPIVTGLLALLVGLGAGLGFGRRRKSVSEPVSEPIKTPVSK
jgi:copper resistance protein C